MAPKRKAKKKNVQCGWDGPFSYGVSKEQFREDNVLLNLLSMPLEDDKNAVQVKEDDESVEDDNVSICSDMAELDISENLEKEKLEKKLLDSLARICVKTAADINPDSQVTAIAMERVQEPGGALFRIAKNGGTTNDDGNFLRKFLYAVQVATYKSEGILENLNLLKELIEASLTRKESQVSRLIRELANGLPPPGANDLVATSAKFSDSVNAANLQGDMEVLSNMCNMPRASENPIVRIEIFLLCSRLRRKTLVRKILERLCPKTFKLLFKDIQELGSYYDDIRTVIIAFQKLEYLQGNISVFKLPKCKGGAGINVDDLRFFEVLSSRYDCPRSLVPWTSFYTNARGNSHEVLEAFKGLCNMASVVHAEVQISTFYLQAENSQLAPVPYIGSSKEPCFLCKRFITSIGRFSLADSRNKLYVGWTVPERLSCKPSEAEIIKKAIIETGRTVAARVRQLLGAGEKPKAVKSTISDDEEGEEVYLEGKLQDPPYPDTFSAPGELGPCSSCDEDATYKCPACFRARYCSRSCQERARWFHDFKCVGRPITTTHHLLMACIDDLLPKDTKTCFVYGFNNCSTWKEKSNLLGLYQSLFRSDVDFQILHEWKEEGRAKMAKNIIQFFEDYGIDNDYVKWFRKNTHVLTDKPLTVKEDACRLLKVVLPFLNRTDQRLYSHHIGGPESALPTPVPNFHGCKTEREKELLHPFVTIYAMLLWSEVTKEPALPAFASEEWREFGFATCANQAQEVILANAYIALLHACGNIYEVLRAYQTSTLGRLLQAKGLAEHYDNVMAIEATMGRPSETSYSLICHVLGSSRLTLPIRVDYGFVNCRNSAEEQELGEYYKSMFAGLKYGELDDMWNSGIEVLAWDPAKNEYKKTGRKKDPKKAERVPIQLHQACVSGRLAEFVEAAIGKKLPQSKRRLFRNLYPLEVRENPL